MHLQLTFSFQISDIAQLDDYTINKYSTFIFRGGGGEDLQKPHEVLPKEYNIPLCFTYAFS